MFVKLQNLCLADWVALELARLRGDLQAASEGKEYARGVRESARHVARLREAVDLLECWAVDLAIVERELRELRVFAFEQGRPCEAGDPSSSIWSPRLV